MKKHLRISYGMVFIGLLTTGCQKEDMPSPALTNTTVLMSLRPTSSPIKIPGTGKNNGPSLNNRDRSKSPNTKSYLDHKELLSKGGYSPNTYDKYAGKHFNDYQKDDNKSSDY